MTQRKPFGVSLNSWIDRQIQEARERGDFNHLPGRGAPIQGTDQPYDPDWWIKDKVKRENLGLTPKIIEIKRKVEEWQDRYLKLSHVAMVRHQATQLNEEIVEANKSYRGPVLPQPLLKIEELCAQWLAHHR